MPSKNRKSVVFDAETLERFNDYMQKSGFTSQSEAMLELIRLALEDMRRTGELPPRLPQAIRKRNNPTDEHISKYINLGPMGKEVVNAVIDVVDKYSNVDKYDDPDIAAQKFKEDFILEKKAQEESAHSGATSTA